MKVIVISAIAVFLSGCSSLKNLVKGTPKKEPTSVGTKFSDQENLAPPKTDRKYKRMTRGRFEDEAEVGASAGSLWVMEGQGAYLFAQNQRRMVGDILNVKIEGPPKQQLQGKVKVISKLLERLEMANKPVAERAPAAEGAPAAGQPPAPGAQAASAPGAQAASAPGDVPGALNPSAQEPAFAVPVVPTRIIEQLRDGSFRVRGTQAFMIGRREYKVIVTGIVRSEDFDEAGIDAAKLLDSQFDVVSAKKGATM